MFCHEAYAEVSDQVDDALSGSYHFMTWIQACSRFAPNDAARSLAKIRSAIGRDRAGPFSFTVGMAEATLLHHLEAEQVMWSRMKGELLSPLVDHVNVTKRQKEAIDKKMRLLVTRIHNGKRKLAAEKKSIEKDLEEYYSCLRDPENPSNARKIPGLKKKLSTALQKYETAVKDLAVIEKDYRDNIPNQMRLLHDLEKNRLKEVQSRLQTLSQVLLERAQDLIESRCRLESYIASLPAAQAQHDKMTSKWVDKFKDAPDLPLVAYDLPVTYLNIESAHDISNIDAAEAVFEEAQQKLSNTRLTLNGQLTKIQHDWDDEDAMELAKFNQQAQITFQSLIKTTGSLGDPSNVKRGHVRQESTRKPVIAKVAPLTRNRMTVVERAPMDDSATPIPETNAGQWQKLQDPETQDWYYENLFTGETTLEEPEGFISSAVTTPSPLLASESKFSLNLGEESAIPHTTDNLSLEEKKKLVGEIQKVFTNANLLVDDRHFVRWGMLTKKCRSRDKDYEFFLFNDLLVWATRSGKKFKFHKSLVIDASFRVHDMPPKPTVRQEFAVQSVDKSFVVMVDNFQEKCGWLHDINECYQQRK